jgi:hypothetical protein
VRRFLAALACFVAALFLIDRGLFLALRSTELHYYGNSNFERRLSQYLMGRSFSTLIFGTSRTYEGVIPAHFENCLNQKCFKETFQGKGPKYNYYFYQLYKKHAGAPKVVIYGVDYFIYAVESDMRWMSRFNLRPDTHRPDLWSAPLLLLSRKKHNDIFLNNLMIDLSQKTAIAPPHGDDLFDPINRYPGAPMQADNPRLVTEKPSSFPFQDMVLPPGVEGDYFLRLLDELKNDGVKVALVSLPDYIGSLKTNREMPRFHRHLRDLQKKYPNITLLIYNSPQQFDLNTPTLFMDGGWGKTNSHLSGIGAARLGRKLCRDLAPLYR